MDLSKLTLQIFSKLEQKWLLSSDGDVQEWSSSSRKTRILTIDGGLGPEGLVAAHTLARLETHLQILSSNPSARIPHFFDIIAGTGLGGVLAALLTATSDPSSHHPLLSAAEASELLLSNLPDLFLRHSFLLRNVTGGYRYSSRSFEAVLRKIFKGLTLRDTCRPLLIPCYDLGSSAPLVFSRADAAESACFDFELWKVCRATAATPGLFRPFRLRSVDGRTACEAVDGGLVMNNPSAAAVTHVLHNKRDFPHVRGVHDLLLLSVGNGMPSDGRNLSRDGRVVMDIVLRGVSDTVDQILANAFSWNPTDYIRIQAYGLVEVADDEGKKRRMTTAAQLRAAGERMLREKGLEALPFGGKRLLEETNAERLEALARRIVPPPRPEGAEKPLLLLPAPASPHAAVAAAEGS